MSTVNKKPPSGGFLWYNIYVLLWDASFLTGGQRTGSPVNRGTEPTTVVPKGTYWGRKNRSLEGSYTFGAALLL